MATFKYALVIVLITAATWICNAEGRSTSLPEQNEGSNPDQGKELDQLMEKFRNGMSTMGISIPSGMQPSKVIHSMEKVLLSIPSDMMQFVVSVVKFVIQLPMKIMKNVIKVPVKLVGSILTQIGRPLLENVAINIMNFMTPILWRFFTSAILPNLDKFGMLLVDNHVLPGEVSTIIKNFHMLYTLARGFSFLI